MRKVFIKFLTLTMGVFCSFCLHANTIIQENANTHLRWNIFAPKGQIVIEKNKNIVYFKTLNVEVYEQLKKSLNSLKVDKSYMKEVALKEPSKEFNVSSLAVTLSDESIELFNFYKDKDQKYVVDFWINADKVAKKEAAIKKNSIKVLPRKPVKPIARRKISKSKAQKKPGTRKKSIINNKPKKFRDFRYGASFVWDYPAMMPAVENIINLDRKTPEYFYPIKDRKVKGNEIEAHLQLSINLYRKKKWGLMYKSIKLFQKKYGDLKHWDINEYLKANAVLRNNFSKGNEGPIKAAVNMYIVIAEKTKEYELKKALYKYILSFYLEKSDLVNSLEYAKKFYETAKENFDYEESTYGIDIMFNTLARLKQIDQINSLMKEKTIIKLMSKQKMIAYKIYSHLVRGEPKKAIQYFEKNQKGLAKPVMGSILYNIGESLFRLSRYNSAIKLFDDFVKDNSHTAFAGKARNRIALSYEITGKPSLETLALYKNAIDRNSAFQDAYEARVRYVALRTIRKKKLDESDKEIRVFLSLEDKNKKHLTRDLKILLWQTRLRSFIVDARFSEALHYLQTIPTHSFRSAYRRVFQADGAEIIYGIMTKNYDQGNFSEVVKDWEVYKEEYINKVALDPYLNFIVGHSYIKLGLTGGFDRIFNHFYKLRNEPNKTFPIWVDRKAQTNNEEMLLQMEIVRHIFKEEYRSAIRKNVQLMSKYPSNVQTNFYNGEVYYKLKQFKKAILEYEKYIARVNISEKTDLSDTAILFNNYADAVYQAGDTKKYQEVAKAILKDSNALSKNNKLLREVREKIQYFLIESLVDTKKLANTLQAEVEIKNFLKEFSGSKYKQRVNYLLGTSLINNKKLTEAKKVFESLLKEEELPNTLKELINSELTLLKIKDRT